MPQLPTAPVASEATPVAALDTPIGPVDAVPANNGTAKADKKAEKKTAAPVKKAAPAKTVKKAAPKAVKKATKAAPGKVGEKGTKAKKQVPVAKRAKKDGLSKPQVRILQCLSKNKKPLTRAEISAKAPVDNAYCTSYIGSLDATIRAKNDTDVGKSLLTLKYVAADTVDVDNRDVTVYRITEAGRTALAAIPKK